MISVLPIQMENRNIPVGFAIGSFVMDGKPRLALMSEDASLVYCFLPDGTCLSGGQEVVKIEDTNGEKTQLVAGARNLTVSFIDAAGDAVAITALEHTARLTGDPVREQPAD